MNELLFYDLKCLSYQKIGGTITPLRRVTQFEIEYQLCDGGDSCINEKRIPIKHGQVMLAKPGMQRNTVGSYQCLAMHFSCRDKSLSDQLCKLPDVLLFPSSGKIEELLRSAYESRMDGESRGLRLEGILMQILAEYIDGSALTSSVPKKYRRYADGIYKTAEYMQKNFAQEISCEDLAKKMFISTNFYQKIFKEIMEISPASYLRKIRITEACRLLANTDLSIQEIAENCGFSCASYFIHVIRKELGVTPLQYRNANQTLL